MPDHTILDLILARVKAVLGPIIEEAQSSPQDWTLWKLETSLWSAFMEVALFTLLTLMGHRTGRQGKWIPGHRDVGDGSHELEYKGLKGRTLHTLFGTLTYKRAYYHSSEPADSRWPRDEELGLVPGEPLTPTLQERFQFLCTVTGSYDKGAQTLRKFTPVALEYKQGQRECVKLGAELEKLQQTQIEEVFEQGQMSPTPVGPPPEAGIISTDGVTVSHYAGGDMEIKLGRLDRATVRPPRTEPTRERTLKPRQGRRCSDDGDQRTEELRELKDSKEQRQYRSAEAIVKSALEEVAPERNDQPRLRQATEKSSYVATARLGPDTFGRALWLAACELGFLKAPLLLFLADGSKWCWELCRTHFPQAVQILDVFHLADHLVAAAHALWGQNPDRVRAWSHDIMARLLRGELDGVLEELRVLEFFEASRREAHRRLVGYLESNRERMDYPRYIAAGYPISSALIEGACNHVIGSRMKGCGRRWEDDGADAMARLRALECSGRWERFHTERQARRLEALRDLRKAA